MRPPLPSLVAALPPKKMRHCVASPGSRTFIELILLTVASHDSFLDGAALPTDGFAKLVCDLRAPSGSGLVGA